jgi:hypothetical protein
MELGSRSSLTNEGTIETVTLTSCNFGLLKIHIFKAESTDLYLLTIQEVTSSSNTYSNSFLTLSPMYAPYFTLSINQSSFTNDIFSTSHCMIFEGVINYIVIDVVHFTSTTGKVYLFSPISEGTQTAEVGNSTFSQMEGK